MKTGLFTQICIIFLVGFNLTSDFSVRGFKFGLSNRVIPEKGSNISMICEFGITFSRIRYQSLIVKKGETDIANCRLIIYKKIFCDMESGVSERYTITGSSRYRRDAFLNITVTNLQTSDAGNWYCRLQTTEKSYKLIVYSPPSGLLLNGSSKSEDLSVQGVDLICKTSNCVYPAPENIQWFYKEADTWHLYSNETPSSSLSTCNGSEKVYSSTLNLVRNTVWPLQPTNADITVKFQCRLNFPTLKLPLRSTESKDVKFAVKVTSVSLEVDNRSHSCPEMITVTSGTSTRFLCLTSTSRPPATVVWYIGSIVQQKNKSTEFTYIAKYTDNDKQIYCKAFNIQKEENAVSSSTKLLRIFVTHSVTDKTDTTKHTSDNTTVIVGVVLGLVMVVLVLYAVIVTIKFKRIANFAEDLRRSLDKFNTESTYRNASCHNDATEQHEPDNQHFYTNATSADCDYSMQEYTDLNRCSTDNQETYDEVQKYR